jgi:hypothetical protein
VKVYVIVGAPLHAPTHDGRRASRAEMKQLTEELHEVLQTLFDEARVLAGD